MTETGCYRLVIEGGTYFPGLHTPFLLLNGNCFTSELNNTVVPHQLLYFCDCLVDIGCTRQYLDSYGRSVSIFVRTNLSRHGIF